jgi:hypothetical protein
MIRPLRRRSPAGLLVMLVIAVALAAGMAGPAAAAGWLIQSTPDPAGGQLDGLIAVSCSSATACTAVGNEETSSASLALAERWNGSTWTLQTAVDPSGDTSVILDGVSCPSATYCVAVGSNGSGKTATAVAESWNGSGWTLLSPVSPAGASLSGVSCISATSCEAVGWATHAGLAESWNGSTWTSQAAPDDVLRAVSCVSASYCNAVSAYWNGSIWTAAQATPTMISYGISCVSASSCEAVGIYGENAAAASWNGSTWTAETVPNPGGSVLYSVSCTSSSSCVAGGDIVTGTGGTTLAEQWNGSSWSEMTTPNPSGAYEANFQGISCPSSTDCTAVGDWYATSPALAQTLGEQWTG